MEEVLIKEKKPVKFLMAGAKQKCVSSSWVSVQGAVRMAVENLEGSF